MNHQELLQLMADSAKDAVNVANEEFNIQLDFTAASAEQIDIVLTNYLNTYQDQIQEDKALFTLCNLFGAYLGETARKLIGGKWIFDETNTDAPSIFLSIHENTYAFAGICYEKLAVDSNVSVAQYFESAVSSHMAQ